MLRHTSTGPLSQGAVLVLFLSVVAPAARANHGPGASGGGAATISGETLKQGHFELELREDFSQFQQFDRASAAHRAMQGGDFDALNHGFITTASATYGITDNFQMGLSLGYFIG